MLKIYLIFSVLLPLCKNTRIIKCDTIGQNESEIAQVKFSVLFIVVLLLGMNFNATFSKNPMKIGWLAVKEVKGFSKITENRGHILFLLGMFQN